MSDFVDVTVRVRYAETDQMGVAYYANHLVWFELGRTEFIRRRGYTYGQIEEQDGCYFVVAEARCRYHSPARYDEELTVRTWLKGARSRLVRFTYEILGPGERKVATGETVLVITDAEGKPRSLPEHCRQALLSPSATPAT